MDPNQLKQLGQLPDERLTAILVDMFGQIARKHSTGTGLGEFTWKNVEVAPNGRLFINWCGEKELDDDVRARNHRDYAGVVYCVATGRKSAESMQWDAERTVRQPVLREIVLTLCGRNDSEIPLLRKLCEPYVDEATFFADYLTSTKRRSGTTGSSARNTAARKKPNASTRSSSTAPPPSGSTRRRRHGTSTCSAASPPEP